MSNVNIERLVALLNYFTTPKEAVMQALKKKRETPEECSPNEIAKETGMPLYVV